MIPRPLFTFTLGMAAAAALGTSGVQATLIARDGFEYANGSALAGATGPLGFSGPYTVSNSGLSVSSPGFTYGDLPVSGNKLNFAGTTNNGNFGVLANSPEAPDSTIYFSYLMKVNASGGYAGVSLFEGGTETLFTGKRSGTASVFGLEPKAGAGVNSTLPSDHLSLVVCRIDFAADSAVIRMYVNPQSAAEPTTADATVTRTSALTYDRIRFQSSDATGSVDEFRMGDTFSDVAPITVGSIPKEIVVIGSSVANGSGASPQSNGWAFRMENLLENQAPIVPGSKVAWQVEHSSVGGNNTSNLLSRFQADVTNAHPAADMVMVGLSLGNEGLAGAANPQAVFDSYKNGMAQIVARIRAMGAYPVVALCYPHNNYSAAEYGYLKRMNVLLNTWDVPSVNFLGAIDDGSGHWAPGNFADALHPNTVGHGELYSAIVPSLFDAITAGKTTRPEISGTRGFLRLSRDETVAAPMIFTPAQPVASFTLALRVRSTEVGTVASIGSGTNRATLEIRDNAYVYVGPGGVETSAVMDANDGRWHDIAVSHRHATGTSLLFVDGQLKGSVNDQYTPDFFSVGGTADAAGRAAAPLQADYQDVCIYRAAWTQDEALAQSSGALQQASLEICAPLGDAAPVQGSLLENRAQSLAAFTLQSSDVTPMLAANTPDGLEAASYASSTVSLSWTDHSNGTVSFTIERRVTGSATPWVIAGTSPAGSTHFEDSGLTNGTSYDYRVSIEEGALQGDYSNVVTIAPSGQNTITYSDWIRGFYPPAMDSNPTYLIDFNTNASPAYGGVKWNTVTSTSDPAPYPLSDSGNNPSGFTVSITDSFDQFRSDPAAPLAGYAAAAQNSQFGLRDGVPLRGEIKISGLDPAATYDFSFFALRGSLVANFDYTGTYTFTGSGAPVVVTANAAGATNLTRVAPVTPSATGEITLTITAGPGAGTDFPVINFLKFRRSTPGLHLIDFNTNASPNYGGVKWNTVTSTSNATPYPLVDTELNSAGISVAVTDSFDQFRSDNVAPLADYPAAAQNSQFCLRDDVPLTGAFTFTGLDPAAMYDFAFFARRGSLVANFDYTGTYTFAGKGDPVTVIVDAAGNTALTKVPGIAPTAAGVVTLTLSAGPGSGTDFPVINFIQLQRTAVDPAYIATLAAGADPEDDGMSNFEEYARGFDPTLQDFQPFQIGNFTLDGTTARLVFTSDRTAADAGYVVEKSTDLMSWQTDDEATQSVTGYSGSMKSTLVESPVTPPAKFLRLRLSNLATAP